MVENKGEEQLLLVKPWLQVWIQTEIGMTLGSKRFKFYIDLSIRLTEGHRSKLTKYIVLDAVLALSQQPCCTIIVITRKLQPFRRDAL